MSDNDDALIGRLLSRREVLGLFGIAGAALIVGCDGDDDPAAATRTPGGASTAGATQEATAAASATSPAGATVTAPSCVVIPELTEGPYFVDEMLERSDIRSDPGDNNSISEGDQLDLTINVSRIGGDGSCTPLASAQVDVWHCDALGVYSDVTDAGFDTTGQKFLRGHQITDEDGQCSFTTIYPGWYQGRATHIHFKVRTEDGFEFTSQWFFDDALSDTVHAQGAYASKGVSGRLRNDGDGIFQGADGLLTLDAARSGAGYAATFDIGLQVA